MLGVTIVVLNSSEDIVTLFEKRSSIYSDRRCPPMVAEPSLYVLAQLSKLSSTSLNVPHFLGSTGQISRVYLVTMTDGEHSVV